MRRGGGSDNNSLHGSPEHASRPDHVELVTLGDEQEFVPIVASDKSSSIEMTLSRRLLYGARFWILKRESTGVPVNALSVFMFVVFLVIVVLHQLGIINSYENYRSSRIELSLGDLSSWCLNVSQYYSCFHGSFKNCNLILSMQSKENLCRCANPLRPIPRSEHDGFKSGHRVNTQMALTSPASGNWDVVFYGDSITEGWKGTSYGIPKEQKLANYKVFESLFGGEESQSKLSGLALGISGDRVRTLSNDIASVNLFLTVVCYVSQCPHLLWRLQHGELPPSLKAKVFWILIGTNDLPCSEDAIYMGIVRIIDELREKRPDSMIVVNGLLPRAHEGTTGLLNEKTNNSKMTKWEGVQLINQRLETFAYQNDKVHYFDAMNLFTATNSDGQLYIPTSLMYDYLHPTAEGYRIWGEEIVKTLKDLNSSASNDEGGH